VTLRVVLDTNIIVSALVFRSGRLGWLRRGWKRQDLVPLVCKSTFAELLRVLSYPKFGLDEAEIRDLLGDFLPFAETVSGIEGTTASPRCRDAHDQVFLDLALAAGADALVTGDSDLLVLAEASAVPIINSAELRRRLDATNR
jgi:putative PIN family toxin of toxin-antitoxin system